VKKNSTRRFIYYQLAIMVSFFTLTLLNEFVDLPHLLLGDPPIAPIQRRGEIILEIVFAIFICWLEIWFVQKLRRDIRILEGFLPICAHCKKIRELGQWEPVEQYIKSHSLADFTHSICPDCLKIFYPDISRKIQGNRPRTE
jgi:hypothetical protein